jgi:hypothetical protein
MYTKKEMCVKMVIYKNRNGSSRSGIGRKDWSGPVQGHMLGYCKCCIESSGSVNAVKFLAS